MRTQLFAASFVALAQITQTDAAFPQHALSRASERLRGFARRQWHGVGLARDIRIVLRGISGENQFAVQTGAASSGKVICARPDSLGALGIGNGNASATSPASSVGGAGHVSPTPTKGGSTTKGASSTKATAAPTSVPSSAFKLVESHVRCLLTPQTAVAHRMLVVGVQFLFGMGFLEFRRPYARNRAIFKPGRCGMMKWFCSPRRHR